MSAKRDHKLGSMPVLKLMGRLTLYYAVIFALLAVCMTFIPGVKDFMPFGGGAALQHADRVSAFEQGIVFSNLSSDYKVNSLRLLCAVLGVIQVMLPISWIYLKSRVKSALDQSMVQTMLLLPIAVAGVVIIVQNSLALAFSLAGIVAAVRFRNTLKNTGDSLFIFIAIGAGLAAGVRVLEVAIVVSIVFNYTFLILWDLDYGSDNAVKFMRASNAVEKQTEEGGAEEASLEDNPEPSTKPNTQP